MRATVHHRGHGNHTTVKPAALRVATVALALFAATVPASAAMASETAPGSTTAAVAKTLAGTAQENPSGIADLLKPLGHTWGN
ncbi:hypothetical protein [Streptomyces sp. A0592]|uniref:hypothetical protein n=1 Tax=Streptomyces sp. A0592 TaxID=2563099 RepID=UPI00109EC498|nr:hypothetical protein [Streptomyces sp. A0592]THA74579.1 hypothetical protein E6U81_37860 [Streptomyces sp. A0592]